MNDIKWQEGAVCFADGCQWICHNGKYLRKHATAKYDAVARELNDITTLKDFQLNEIRIGDYIEKSELDTEQKYNDVIEVFWLFGHKCDSSSGYGGLVSKYQCVVIYEEGYSNTYIDDDVKRKLTYNQIMAIGELKRMMNEREEKEVESDNVKNPSHYQLLDGIESIEIIARSMTHEQWKGFCLGNMLKYRIRAGKKDALQQDIDKANYYGELYELHKDKCYESNN